MAISLNDHERRIKDFEGQVNTINSKITSLENRPSSKVVTLQWNGRSGFIIPSEFSSKNYAIVTFAGNGTMEAEGGSDWRYFENTASPSLSNRGMCTGGTKWEGYNGPGAVEFKRSGNTLNVYFNDRSGIGAAESYPIWRVLRGTPSMTVIFY